MPAHRRNHWMGKILNADKPHNMGPIHKNMEDWYVGNIGLLEWLLLHVQQYSLYLIYSRCESLDHDDFKLTISGAKITDYRHVRGFYKVDSFSLIQCHRLG